MGRARATVSDIDAANEWMTQQFDTLPMELLETCGEFDLQIDSVVTRPDRGILNILRIRHTRTVRAVIESPPVLLVSTPVHGGGMAFSGRSSASSTCLVPLHEATELLSTDFDGLLGSIDLDSVLRVGALSSGMEPETIRFTGTSPTSQDSDAALRNMLLYIGRMLFLYQESGHSPLGAAELFRHFSTVVLELFPNTTHRRPDERVRSGPATILRAIQFMDEHAHESIDLLQVCEAARIGPRGLQNSFQRHRDQSPMQYLRRVRLDRAHRELMAGDPTKGDSVSEIAAKWGFHHPGRFSVEYRNYYGRSPSRTLRE